MGNTQSAIKYPGYTLVSEDEQMILVKNEGGDQFVIKKFDRGQENNLNFLLQLDHPHIVHHKEVIAGPDCLYLVLELCEGGDLTQKIKHKTQEADTFSENEILDWTVKICMALKHLHDQQILHKNLQPKSLFFTACGIIRLGEFGDIYEWSTDAHTTDTEALAYVAPENLSGRPYDQKSEIWRLGCVIYELCKLKSAFKARNPVEIVTKILTCSYEALPNTFSEDLRQLVKDTLQKDPEHRPSVSEILMRPFIIEHLHSMSIQTIEELYKTLDVMRNLADGLETVHFNTTVSSLTGGVVGLAGGITSIVGLILTPFTLGASLIVTGVGIGTAVAGGITAGASNITNMVNQQTNRQKITKILTEFQEKITSIICCIQNISTAVETLQNEFSTSSGSLSSAQSGMRVGARLGRGLGGIPELLRLTQVINVGKIAAQAARAVRVAEAATGVLSALFIAVDVFFVFLDSREIHNIRRDYALKSSRQESTSNQTTGLNDQSPNNSDTTNLLPSNTDQVEEMKSETMKFVTKIKETTEELQTILDTLRDALNPNSETPNTDNLEFVGLPPY
uniref:non-specific serine/threonine protein kinase n=1 Tax=Cyprinus carpio TaxID=7962 RepID=A0A8C1QKM9_CYPCA